MTKTKGLYRLTDQEREILRWAKAGFLPEDLVKRLKKIIALRKNLEPILLLGAICRGKYGEVFGNVLFTYYGTGIFREPQRAADKHRDWMMKALFGKVDLGGPIRRPSARAIAEAEAAARSAIQAEAGR